MALWSTNDEKTSRGQASERLDVLNRPHVSERATHGAADVMPAVASDGPPMESREDEAAVRPSATANAAAGLPRLTDSDPNGAFRRALEETSADEARCAERIAEFEHEIARMVTRRDEAKKLGESLRTYLGEAAHAIE